MSALTAKFHPASRPAPAGLSRLADVVVRAFTTWRAARMLSGMDDHMLHDLGISRGEIDHAVRHGRH